MGGNGKGMEYVIMAKVDGEGLITCHRGVISVEGGKSWVEWKGVTEYVSRLVLPGVASISDVFAPQVFARALRQGIWIQLS